MYVSGASTNALSIADIGPTDIPTPKAGSPITPGPNPQSVVQTPDGRHLYVVINSHQVATYSVAPDGSLTAGPLVDTGVGTTPYGMTITPDGKFVYVGTANPSAILVYSFGADGSLTPVPNPSGSLPPPANLQGLAVAPDGKTFYAADFGNGQILYAKIGADGSLSDVTAAATNRDPYDMAITPDGKYMYTGDYAGDLVLGFSLGAGGAPTELPGTPPSLNAPYDGFAITPDGKHLYVTGYEGTKVGSYAIAADGSLTAVGTFPTVVTSGTSAAVTPDGRFLYTTASTGMPRPNYGYSIGGDGALTSLTGSPFDLGGGAADQAAIAITPNQPPIAALSTTVAGGEVSFDASASADSDGTVATYAWDFGDGQTSETTTPTTSHKYATGGDYTATVTLTDDEGCSVDQIYTGRATLCNGSDVARKSVAVKPDTTVDGPKVSAEKSQKQKGSLKIAVKVGAGEKVSVVASGSAAFKGLEGKVALKKAKASVEAGKTKTLKLKAKKKAQGKAVVGSKGKAKLSVQLTDEAGNVVTKKLSVKLK